MVISSKGLLLNFMQSGYEQMMAHFENISLEEALFVPIGGYRSVLGTLKHAAGWSHVYYSYAFEEEPRHWAETCWPYGLRDRILKSTEYLEAVINWFTEAHFKWMGSLKEIVDEEIETLHKLHWGEEVPLYRIVTIITQHHVYHAGELNQVLSICRGEAWEEGEEVEENNISTIGHRVKPPWKDG